MLIENWDAKTMLRLSLNKLRRKMGEGLTERIERSLMERIRKEAGEGLVDTTINIEEFRNEVCENVEECRVFDLPCRGVAYVLGVLHLCGYEARLAYGSIAVSWG